MGRRIVLVEYFFTSSKLFAFGIRSDFDEPKVMEIAIDVDALRNDISGAAPDLDQRASEVVQWPSLARCIEPIAEWAEPEDVVCLVPSGPLFYIPLHAVPLDGDPLIVRNPVFYAPSASALRYCVRRRETSPGPLRTPVVFGNPTGELLSARKEAIAVASFLDVDALLWKNVTRDSLRRAMRSSDLIHFAGHAKFDESDPLASGLILSDGVLTAREIFELGGTSLRLVTLSGCVTGYNTIHPGDELIGLTRAFLYAGASSLLVTLWKIEDKPASGLMQAFYRRWIKEDATKVDALRGAQRELLDEYPGNPSRWAPYFLIGDWM
jgi:CHAT domain-containing protein